MHPTDRQRGTVLYDVESFALVCGSWDHMLEKQQKQKKKSKNERCRRLFRITVFLECRSGTDVSNMIRSKRRGGKRKTQEKVMRSKKKEKKTQGSADAAKTTHPPWRNLPPRCD